MKIDLKSAVVRFAGDSGDGMQLVGAQFATTSAEFGNDLATFPDYPAEIRAPIGTRAGVSAYQIHFASSDISTPGDELDALVAMNVAALLVHRHDLKTGGILIVDTYGFDEKHLKLAECKSNPLEDGTLSDFRVIQLDIHSLTEKALAGGPVKGKNAARCKNMWALGLVNWIFGRPLDHTEEWIRKKFAAHPEIAEANISALRAGNSHAETLELFQSGAYEVKPAKLPPGEYRKISGNEACALGLVAASKRSGRRLFLGSYPITPASQILHELAQWKHFGVETFQAEDEIAAAASAVGAAFGGGLAVTTTSGPGLCLKMEAINLAVKVELPVVIINVQRGGPSTGLPTKTEQSDLLQATFGRNGDSPLPVLAAASPADCFDATLEACQIALRHMTPVILLTDGYIANGSEPWLIPAEEDLPDLRTPSMTREMWGEGPYLPYKRDVATGARPWAIPGTPDLEHRIGGIEGESLTGKISYDSLNHQVMTDERQAKLAAVADFLPPATLRAGKGSGDLLVVSWGGTLGSVATAVDRLLDHGASIAHLHLRMLNPLPKGIDDIIKSFRRVLVPEWNVGQLQFLLQGRLGVKVHSYQKVQGQPFKVSELVHVFEANLTQSGVSEK
jgi:2-oxoglutarate ferredoxin oxidoreductase subunit alpha